MLSRAEQRRLPVWPCFLLAAAARALVAVRTPIPDHDAAHYLWMAERAASGELSALFDSVFHPLWSALLAPWIALGLEPLAVAQTLGVLLGALTVFPLFAFGERMVGSLPAWWGCVFYGLGAWFCRMPADAMSESLFLPLVACSALAITAVTPRPLAAGLLVGCAFATRPEGVFLLLLGGLRLQRRAGWSALRGFLLGFALIYLPLFLGWWVLGPGPVLTSKLGFVHSEGVGTLGFGHYFEHLMRLPGAACEALGYLILPLALFGYLRRPAQPGWQHPLHLALGLFVLQLLVVPWLKTNLRFLLGYGVLLLPLAGSGFAALRIQLRLRLAGTCLLFLLVTAGDLARLPQWRRLDRQIERDLGRHIAADLEPGEEFCTDMPRLRWYAGRPPIPPRRMTDRELLQWCARPENRLVALVEGRSGLDLAALRPLGYRPLTLPPALAGAMQQRGILYLERGSKR